MGGWTVTHLAVYGTRLYIYLFLKVFIYIGQLEFADCDYLRLAKDTKLLLCTVTPYVSAESSSIFRNERHG